MLKNKEGEEGADPVKENNTEEDFKEEGKKEENDRKKVCLACNGGDFKFADDEF
jgi:hypothetical protein